MKTYLTKKEASKEMRMSERKIDYLRSSGVLPSVKSGNQVLFLLEDIRTYMLSCRVVPVPVCVTKKNP